MVQIDPVNEINTMSNNNENKTTPEVRKLIRLWITGNDKRDARKLSKDLAWVSTDISFWLDVIAETRQMA